MKRLAFALTLLLSKCALAPAAFAQIIPTAQGEVPIIQYSVVSTVNSTTAALSGGAAFTGTFEDVSRYAAVSVIVFANQASASNGLEFHWSSDATNADYTETHTISASTGATYILAPRARYFRVKYTNGGSGQATFRLSTLYRPVGIQDPVTADTELPAAVALNDTLANPTAPAVGAYMLGWTGAEWSRITVDTGGILEVIDQDAGSLLGDISGTLGTIPQTVCNNSVALSVSASGNTELVALTNGQSIKVCSFSFISRGTVEVQFVYGTGSACGTSETDLTGPYSVQARDSLSQGSGNGMLFKTATSNALCIELSANIQVDGVVTYLKN